MARQLVLDLGRDPSYARDAFLVAPCNAAAHAAICRWPAWPDPVLVLTGPAGSGKSHLAAIWAAQSGARVLPLDEMAGEAGTGTLLLEDCDRHLPDEAGLFHLLNRVRQGGGSLLLTARETPNAWGLRTADLVSRLRLAPSATIAPPDSALIRAVILKLFADRQITIDEEVVAYAARHCDRSLEAVARFVAGADEASLATGRRITRPLAAAIVASTRDGAD